MEGAGAAAEEVAEEAPEVMLKEAEVQVNEEVEEEEAFVVFFNNIEETSVENKVELELGNA